MKKTLFAVLLILLFCNISFAIDGFNTWSPRKAATAVIVARPAYVLGVIITADGTNACKVDLYNNASTNSGDYISYNVAAGEAGTAGFLDETGAWFDKGIYAVATIGGGGSCGFNVKYR